VPLPEHGYLALTATLYPDGNAVSAEILEFDIASCGTDVDHAYAMIVEAVEGAIEAAYRDSVDGLHVLLREEKLTVYPNPPRRYTGVPQLIAPERTPTAPAEHETGRLMGLQSPEA